MALDINEPFRVAQQIKGLGLRYVVLTSVTRDDLPDGGAGVFAQTTGLLKKLCSGIKVEVLIPDFKGSIIDLRKVIDAGPQVVGHNIETVRRLYSQVRPQADYGVSLKVLSQIKEINSSVLSKSSIMLGMGETQDELFSAMEDLRNTGCDIITFGQYLAPSADHYPVKEFIEPEIFDLLRKKAVSFGFKACLSGPLVRSSYQAKEIYDQLVCA